MDSPIDCNRILSLLEVDSPSLGIDSRDTMIFTALCLVPMVILESTLAKLGLTHVCHELAFKAPAIRSALRHAIF